MNNSELQRQRAQASATLHSTLLQNTRTTSIQLYGSLLFSLGSVGSLGLFANGYRLLPFVFGTGASAVAVVTSNSHIRNKKLLAGADEVAERRLLDELNDGYNNDRLAFAQTQEEPSAQSPVLQSLREYWLEQDKHLLLVAPTGGGKSRMIQALAQELQQYEPWRFRIMDIDASVEDWGWLADRESNLVNNEADVWETMAAEVEEQERTLTEGKGLGWGKLKQTRTPMLTVVEEAPALSMSNYDALAAYVKARVIRGRKARMFLCVIAQTDDVESVGMKNGSQLRDQSFVRVYLGKAAIDRAKKLKQPELEKALRDGGFSVCLVDDMLCKRPQASSFSSSQHQLIHSGKNAAEEVAEVAEKLTQQGFQPSEAIEVTVVKAPKSDQNTSDIRSTSPLHSLLSGRPAWVIYDDLSDEGKTAVQALLPRCKQADGDPEKLMQLIAEASPRSKSQLGKLMFGVSGGDAFAHVSQLWKDLS